MKIQNKLFLVLFNTKAENKWESWKRFASKNNYFFSTLSDPFERPIIRGQLHGKPLSVEAVNDDRSDKSGIPGKPENEMYLKIKSPIHNPRDLYFLIQDKKAYKSHSGIFDKSLHGICEDERIEEKFFIKSNSERLPVQILRSQTLANQLVSQNNFSIEVIDYELILTSFSAIEINKEFIELLKVFYTFLSTFEEITLDAMMNRV